METRTAGDYSAVRSQAYDPVRITGAGEMAGKLHRLECLIGLLTALLLVTFVRPVSAIADDGGRSAAMLPPQIYTFWLNGQVRPVEASDPPSDWTYRVKTIAQGSVWIQLNVSTQKYCFFEQSSTTMEFT